MKERKQSCLTLFTRIIYHATTITIYSEHMYIYFQLLKDTFFYINPSSERLPPRFSSEWINARVPPLSFFLSSKALKVCLLLQLSVQSVLLHVRVIFHQFNSLRVVSAVLLRDVSAHPLHARFSLLRALQRHLQSDVFFLRGCHDLQSASSVAGSGRRLRRGRKRRRAGNSGG